MNTTVVAFLRITVRSVMAYLGSSWDGPAGKYRPEDHYMRGPGPKWREKHFDGTSAGGA